MAPCDDRTIDGLKPLVRLLERGAAPGVVGAALDALRAAAMNNEDNKAAAAQCWLVPQLVKLIGSDVRVPHSCALACTAVHWPCFAIAVRGLMRMGCSSRDPGLAQAVSVIWLTVCPLPAGHASVPCKCAFGITRASLSVAGRG